MKINRLLLVLVSSFLLASLASHAQAEFPVTNQTAQTPAGATATRKLDVLQNMSSAGAKNKKFSEDSIIVKFKPDASDAGKSAMHKRHGASVAKKFDRLRLHHVKLKKDRTVADAIKEYTADPTVEYAEPDFTVHTLATPSDPGWGSLWGMNRINAPAAWNVSTGSSSVVVAVIDTGIDYNHPDLAANIWVNPFPGIYPGYTGDTYGIDTLNHDPNPFDDNKHGTHVAGTIGAAANNGIGVVGVNWRVKLMACKFLGAGGSGYVSGAIDCLEYVRMLKDAGVNIVATNNSWAASGYDQSLYEAIAAQGDILFIAAAGNDALNIDKFVVSPGGYDLPNVITVAATDANDALASFSNTGSQSVHVAAPGTSIYSTTPGNSYETLQGTSMATPHVTGLAALLAATGKDWKQARNLILSGGDTAPALVDKTITGRRINASGSVSCNNRPFFALQHPPITVQAGVPVTLTAISVNCGSPAAPVTVNLPGNVTLALHDDGVAPDKVANDGIFSVSWTPAGSGGVPATFTYPTGNRTVAIPHVLLADTAAVDPPASTSGMSTVSTNIGTSFRMQFAASGGILPFTWSIVSGTLPEGLSLNSASGEITGTPMQTGIYPITIKVTDDLGFTDSADWTLVVSQGLQPGWPKTLVARAPDGYIPYINSSPVFADLDGDGKQELIVSDLKTLYVFKEDLLAARYEFPDSTGKLRLTTPAVADLFNDGRKQIIVSAGYPLTDPPLYAFDADLNLLPGFPAGGFPTYWGSPGYCGSPIVADLLNDGNKTILVECSPNNGNDANFHKGVVVMVDRQGAMSSGWPVTVGPMVMSEWLREEMPVVGDLDKNGTNEIVSLTSDGYLQIYNKAGVLIARWLAAPDLGDWPNYWTNVWNPVLADFNGDGFLEIAVKQNYFDGETQRQRVSVYTRNGALLPGWPLTFPDLVNEGGIIAADIDNDGLPEIITNIQTGRYGQNNPDGITYKWHAFNTNGSPVAGWPLATATGGVLTKTLPVTGGDGLQNIFFATNDTNTTLWGYGSSGSLLDGFPKLVALNSYTASSPALGDLDGNGVADIAVKAEDGTLHVWEVGQSVSNSASQWPMFAHDLHHAGALPPQDLQLPPLPDFSATPSGGLAPLSVQFTDMTSNAPASWSWNFGDGTVSSLQNPSHVYAATGSYSVSLTAANAYGNAFITKTGLITVTAPITITTATLVAGAVNVMYSQQLGASGGAPPYTWMIFSGSLPAGLSLNESTGMISGVPTSGGTATFTVKVLDTYPGGPTSATKAFSIAVSSPQDFPVALPGSGYFSLIEDAYLLAADSSIIKLKSIDFSSSLLFNRNIWITLEGGYDNDFGANTAMTGILGALRVSDGTVKLDKLRFK